jgi:ABC-type transporter Mla MlaB component
MPLALTIILLGACRREPPETASADRAAAPAEVAPVSASGDTAVGVEAEAPRLIPAMRAELDQVESGNGGNLESYRGTVSHLIDAMEADLNRSGRVDSGGFKLLADSVLRELGGGAGNPKPDRDAARRSVPAVRRLLDLYQTRMGQPRVAP